MSLSRQASTLASLMVGSVTKSNSSRSVAVATPFLLKKSFTCVRSSRRKSKHRGWSRSTDWDTSMMASRPAWYSRLYSLRSACTRRQRWNMVRTSITS
jgi:hypothetical protein